ncbi:MAG: Crp/Fnr family transcriptional regulator [Cytophagales bacterium]|nr:Crp/Fnr family transcriptional regulator [Bernardetiaceae bacterium]MDW8209695.1 Crp/Fnr family transcriptional regulator [Cytophagales bacterium]
MHESESISAFKSSPALTAKLYEYSKIKHYKAGEVILRENAYMKAIPIVVEGSVRVIRSEEDGREILLYYLRAGESCIMSLLGGIHNEKSKVRAEVEEDAEILFLPLDKALLLVKEFPDWLEYIFRLYHKRFEELLQIINEIAFHKVDERLVSLLNRKVALTGSKVLHVSHEQLANELGTARVVVSRLLKRLEENGVVQLGRNRIVVL